MELGGKGWPRQGGGWKGRPKGGGCGGQHGGWRPDDLAGGCGHDGGGGYVADVPGVHDTGGGRVPGALKPPPGWNAPEGSLDERGFGPWATYTNTEVQEHQFKLQPIDRRFYSGALTSLLRRGTPCPHARPFASIFPYLKRNQSPAPNLPTPVNQDTVWDILVNNPHFELARRWSPEAEAQMEPGIWYVRVTNPKWCLKSLTECRRTPVGDSISGV